MGIGFDKNILVGDVGGTNVRFGLAQCEENGDITIGDFSKIRGDNVVSLEAAIEVYLAQTKAKPNHVSIALAGPVSNGSVTLTNRDWMVSQSNLSDRFGFEHVRLFNDFKAMGRSVPQMRDDDFDLVAPGEAMSGRPILVAGPGTGFGVANLVPFGDDWHVLGSEGGHAAYAPQTPAEFELLKILKHKHEFVSVEMICSGVAMDDIHEAICLRHGVPYVRLTPADVLQRAAKGDAVCLEICTIRSAAVMCALGDMALIMGARGGVVVAGGVAERLIDYIRAPEAMARFADKGAMSSYLKKIPIKLLKSPAAPLIGAAALYRDQYC